MLVLRNERGIVVEEFDEEMKGKRREMIERKRRKEAMVGSWELWR